MHTYLDFTPTDTLTEAERDSDLLLIALAESDAVKGIYRAAGKFQAHGLTKNIKHALELRADMKRRGPEIMRQIEARSGTLKEQIDRGLADGSLVHVTVQYTVAQPYGDYYNHEVRQPPPERD